MALSRKDYVAICQTCVKREFDKNKGVVCSLTKAHADFDITCDSFERDPLAEKRIERMEKHKEEMSQRSLSTGTGFAFERKAMNSGIGGGILMIVGGLVWLIGGLAAGYVFFYPFFLIIGGVIVLIKGVIEKGKKMNKADTSGILDDKEDLEIT